MVVAAGSGSRLGLDVPKAFVDLDGATLLERAVEHLLASGRVGWVVAVVPPDRLEQATRLVAEPGRVLVVVGGADRRASVLAGVRHLDPEVTTVLVHDAARALAPSSLVAAVLDAVDAGAAAVVPALPVTDTVKRVDVDPVTGVEVVSGTVDRSLLRAVQTPQGFARALLERAHAQPLDTVATDDAGLVEALGERVLVVPGDHLAAKITTLVDLELARWRRRQR